MPKATAKYSGEELVVEFSANACKTWEGDPTIPNGTHDIVELEDVLVGTVTLLGVEIEFDKLPEELQGKILALTEEIEFDVEEEESDYEY